MQFGRFRFFYRTTIHNPTGEPYIRRYTLVESPWFKCMVHHILRSDDDRDLHDHPFDFMSIILRGEYLEYYRTAGETDHAQTLWRRCAQGTIVRHRAEDLHRLEVLPGRTVWTLVFCGPRRREWGFAGPDGWQPWKEYLEHTHGTSPAVHQA